VNKHLIGQHDHVTCC